MTEEQFDQMMECLNGISGQLEKINNTLDKATVYGVYTIEDVVDGLRSVEQSVSMVESAVGMIGD